jgi:NAD(P)-dependent dehydrogenase (short-subunit alcohol dehydrogenase family)
MSATSQKKPSVMPPQRQRKQPGKEAEMTPKPEYIRNTYKGSEKLLDKVAIITGGDSGIGRAVAVHFAREGADVCVAYLNEDEDAEETKKLVAMEGRNCLLMRGDIKSPVFCQKIVDATMKAFGKIDILVNNAAEQHAAKNLEDIPDEQIEDTFATNVFGIFYLTKAAMKHMKKGATIINTTSITAYAGSERLMDYAATKGAILAFTRSLSGNLVEKGIRVNGVAPGPIWTPLTVSTFSRSEVAAFGKDQPMKRPGQPSEVAPCYVFLASDDASYMTGQVMHPNGGEIVGG